MSQITLNLIAISIFSVTMMALLGPLVELSPVVPAVTIAGLLGVATLDQLSWDGRAGTFLVESLSRTSSAHRQRIVHHEAGHFLVAHVLGIPVVDYTLSAWAAWRKGLPGQGGVVFDDQDLTTEVAQGQLSAQMLSRYCTLWMAGVAAEQLVYGQAVGGTDDRQKFRILWQQLQRPLSEAAMRERWATLQAKSLLSQHQQAYEVLVTAMEAGEPIEVCRQRLTAAIGEG